jgi:NNP family nitrate/nitrite transporter-like MFS transporter
MGAMEVTSKGDFFLLLLMKIPLYAALALLAWKLEPSQANILTSTGVYCIYAGLVALYVYDAYNVWRVNKDIFVKPVPELHRYRFKQVAILNVLYFANFGSELAVVSMLPLFFAETFALSPVYLDQRSLRTQIHTVDFNRGIGRWLLPHGCG